MNTQTVAAVKFDASVVEPIPPKQRDRSSSNYRNVTYQIPPAEPNAWFGRTVSGRERKRVEKAVERYVLGHWPTGPSAVQGPSGSRRAAQRILTWLDSIPGKTYQDRWEASGADEDFRGKVPHVHANSAASMEIRLGLNALISIGVIRPGHAWAFTSGQMKVWELWRAENAPEEWQRLARTQKANAAVTEPVARAATVLATRICVIYGVTPSQLRAGHVIATWRWFLERGRSASGLHTMWSQLKHSGFLAQEPANFQNLILKKPLGPRELVLQYDIQNESVRDVFIEYFTELSTTLDWSSQNNLCNQLIRLFWLDIEANDPSITSLRLTREQAAAWKARLKQAHSRPTTREALNVLRAVRSFYLDLSAWAHENPEVWAQHAYPNPVSASDTHGLKKERQRTTHRMQSRTRDLAPHLEKFITANRDFHAFAVGLLAEANRNPTESTFDYNGATYIRQNKSYPEFTQSISVVREEASGKAINVAELEASTFWACSACEVLSETGLRVEELLELTHLSIKQFKRPDGTVIPLLQVAPSKNDRERVLPCSPELTATLARIVRRASGPHGSIPLSSRRDQAQREHSAPLPHLFQLHRAGRTTVISEASLRKWFRSATRFADLRLPNGDPAIFTPHDFRRLFITNIVNEGFPIHLAAEIVGHANIDTTRSYTAVYKKDVFDAYDSFIEKRRRLRPSEEYRTPTAQEWNDFREHFVKREVSLGRCHRPYGSSCIHEHACVRCNLLEPDPARRGILDGIESNVNERIEEAQRNQWLGDVDQLKVTLKSIREKRVMMDHLSNLTLQEPVSIDDVAPVGPIEVP